MFFCFNMAADILHENPRTVSYCQPYNFFHKVILWDNIVVYLTLMCSSRTTRTTTTTHTHTHTECIVAFAL